MRISIDKKISILKVKIIYIISIIKVFFDCGFFIKGIINSYFFILIYDFGVYYNTRTHCTF